MSVEDPLAPVPKLDPVVLINRIARVTGVHLQLLGRPAGGEVGAAFVRTPDGHDGVLTAIAHRPAEQIHLTAEVLRAGRDQGLPLPTYDLVLELPAEPGSPSTIAVVQRRLPGSTPRQPDRALAETMVRANARMAGLLADRPEVATPDLYLTHSGPGFCVHESLSAYGGRARRLLDWIREVGADAANGLSPMTGTDLVHLDYTPDNVLRDEHGQLSGIVDWDGLGRGDRRFDLVTLRFDAAPAGFDPDTIRWLDELIEESIEPERLRAFWAHMSLRSVDWMIRHHSPSDVEDRLDLAETRIG